MKKILLILFLVYSTLIAQDAKIALLTVKPLTDVPRKGVPILAVEYPPDGHDPVHRLAYSRQFEVVNLLRLQVCVCGAGLL
jgi:hypothetical protein